MLNFVVYNFEIKTEIKFLRTGKFQKSLFEDHVIDTQTKVRSKLYTIDVLWLNWKRSKEFFNTMAWTSRNVPIHHNGHLFYILSQLLCITFCL